MLASLNDTAREVPQFRGHVAHMQLSDVINAWLVGLAHEVRGPLGRLIQWFEHADAADEQFGDAPHFDSALRNDSWGLSLWMVNGGTSMQSHRKAVEHWEQHFACEGTKAQRGPPKFDYEKQRFEDPFIRGLPFEPKDILHGSLDDYLASCVQCGEFARGAELYEKVGGRTDIADSRIQTPIHLGYWLCKQGRAGGIETDACMKIGGRVLRSNLQTNW